MELTAPTVRKEYKDCKDLVIHNSKELKEYKERKDYKDSRDSKALGIPNCRELKVYREYKELQLLVVSHIPTFS
jgi:hypothetical protein